MVVCFDAVQLFTENSHLMLGMAMTSVVIAECPVKA
jgi:hypothetical protein